MNKVKYPEFDWDEKKMKSNNRILYHLGVLDPLCDKVSEDDE